MMKHACRLAVGVFVLAAAAWAQPLWSEPFELPDDPGTGGCSSGIQSILVDGASEGIYTHEAGLWPFDWDHFYVHLAAAPSSSRRIRIDTMDASEGRLQDPSSGSMVNSITVTFSTTNWNVPVLVLVQGQNDTAPDGNVPYFVRLSNLDSPNPSCLETVMVSAVNVDNEPPPSRSLVASPSSGLLTDKMGKIATSWVYLYRYYVPAPGASVTVEITSNAEGQGLVRGPGEAAFNRSTTLVFTPSNHATPQKVEIMGVDDGLQNGDTPFTVSLRSSSSDPTYHDLTATMALSNVDRTDHDVCISNVVGQFLALPGSDTTLLAPADNIPAVEYDGDPNDEHFQSVARPKHGPYLFLTTKDDDNSQLLVTKFAAKQGIEGRWGANPLLPGDGIVNYAQAHIDSAYDHAGGMGMFGDYMAVPMEDGSSSRSKVIFYDVHQPANPVRLTTQIDRPQYDYAGAAAVTRLADGRYLAAVQSNCPAEVQFYVSDGTPITGSPAWTLTGVWSLYNQDDFPGCNPGNPGSSPTVQNMTFVQECGTGNLYVVFMWNTGSLGINTGWGDDKARLYRVVPHPNLGYSVAPILTDQYTRTFDCSACNFSGGSSIYVSPVSRQMIMYGTQKYKTPDDLFEPTTWRLRMGEF